MAGQKADMVFTDPPYGINLNTDFSRIKGSIPNKGGGKNRYKKIEGDSTTFTIRGWVLDLSSEVFLFGAENYHRSLPENSGSWVVWDKVLTESLGKSIGSNFELCWSKQKHKRDIIRIKWSGFYGFENEDTPKKIHPTQKPVKLAEAFFGRWGKGKTNIVDLFGGSGSTLIACEKTDRTCYMSEIDPHYCQVIIDRWEQYTQQQAIKE
jgi:DNA modification methylase